MDEFRRKPVNRMTIPQRPLQQRPQTSQPTPNPVLQPQPAVQPQASPQPQSVAPPPQPINNTNNQAPKAKKSRKKLILGLIIGFFGLLILSAGALFYWYTSQLASVDSNDTDKKAITIVSGSTPAEIAALLKDEGLIRNPTAFLWYAKYKGVENSLQAGSYRLSPSETTPEITEHLTKGRVDTFSITFLPGSTLADNRKVFIKAGYTEAEVDAALAKKYDSPLFQGKPAEADLEGYIYAETFNFGANTTIEQILEYVFSHYYGVIEKNNLIAGFEAQGLTLFQGINMASIIEKEAVGGDERQIAQVFLLRYQRGEMLGSDPTYQYITDKLGVPRDLNFDSPYNTRRFTGLPPTPIAVPGLTALKAVADPAEGDYMYFLSGDDDVTYFSRTFQEHEANIVKHCQKKCQVL